MTRPYDHGPDESFDSAEALEETLEPEVRAPELQAMHVASLLGAALIETD